MPPPTDPGQLDQRVTIQALPDPATISLAGEQGETWADVATRWAKYEPLSGRDLQRAQSIAGDATAVVWLRYDAALGLAGKSRLIVTTLNNLVLNIVGQPLIWGRKHWLECFVTQAQPQQVT
jgi:SPP1 family predicted phage head-tail adaptor